MNIQIEQGELFRALSKFQSIVTKKTPQPILQYVVLEASGSELTIKGSDNELSLLVKTPAKVMAPGAIALNGKLLIDIVKELQGLLTVGLEAGMRVCLKAGRSVFRLSSIDALEYPRLLGLERAVHGSIEVSTLADLAGRTLYAVSNDETRPDLNGVYFESPADGIIRAVATDGNRLALLNRPAPGFIIKSGVLLPKRGMSELCKILEDVGVSEVKAENCEGYFVVESPSIKLAMNLLVGEFPSYSHIFPVEEGVLLSLDGSSFMESLRRVSLLASGEGSVVRLEFTAQSLRISSVSVKLGEAEDEIPIEFSGTPMSMGFRPKYLLDVVHSLGDKGVIVLQLVGERMPIRFYSPHDESALAVVMPVRVSDYSLE